MIQFTLENLPKKSKEIHERAQARAKEYLSAEAKLLDSIIEVDRDKTYLKFGESHLTPYCVKYLNLSDEVAGTFVRVARKSEAIPALQQAVDKGLAITKAKAICSVITPENRATWIERAVTLPKAKLEKEVAKASPSPRRPERIKPVGENRNQMLLELNDATLANQKRALDVFAQKLGRAPTLAEMQAALLDTYLEKHDPLRKAERSRGRSPKYEVNKRDKGRCQARKPDGTQCEETRWLHLHHVIERQHGGPDTAKNMTTLCSSHHREWHARH